MRLLPSNPSAQTVFHMDSREDQMIFDVFSGSSSSLWDCLRRPGHLLLLFQSCHSSPWRGSFLIFPQVMPTNRHMKQEMIHTQKTLQQTKEQSLVGIQIWNPNLKRLEASFHCSSSTYSSAGFDITGVEYCSVFDPIKCRYFTTIRQKYAQPYPANHGQGGIQNPRIYLTALFSKS